MNNRKNKLLAPFAAAAGLGLALAASSASAAISWSLPQTLFEDDIVDFLIKGAGNNNANILEEGDILAAVLEIQSSAGSTIAPEELTGVSFIEIDTITPTANPTLANISFKAPTLGFDAYSGLPPLSTGGGAGGGATVAFFVDNAPDLDIGADNIQANTTSCLTLATCVAQGGNGTEWLVLGFGGDPDDSWTASNAPIGPIGLVAAVDAGTTFGSFNTGQSILADNTGRSLFSNEISCFPFCGAGGDGFVDAFGSGTIKGGGVNPAGTPGGEWFSSGDFDISLRPVPEPATIALFGAALLGMGAARRRKAS